MEQNKQTQTWHIMFLKFLQYTKKKKEELIFLP